MPRKRTSQWDFGDLFDQKTAPSPSPSPAATRQVFTVTELTGRVRRLLEGEFPRIWVSGEISNLRTHTSGHSYFTVKDAGAQLSCVLFRSDGREARKLLADGQHVLLQGDVTVYEPRGQYQLRVVAVELQGVGALQMAFEQLKQKLHAEGLFAPERKRPVPRYCERIGLVTSPTGAAIRDVLNVVGRRQPGLELILAPCRVQGDGAAGEIVEAVELLNHWSSSQTRPLDLILLTRGGGSLEDLWAFNEEAVARAVAASSLPVISAVGHEIDFTISDFVADLRAATPSAAAEIITQGGYDAAQFVSQTRHRLQFLARQQVDIRQEAVARAIQRLARLHPRRVIDEKLQYLDDLQLALARHTLRQLRDRQVRAAELGRRLQRLSPSAQVGQHRRVLAEITRSLLQAWRGRRTEWDHALGSLRERLRLLSPEHVLARGYSITTDAASGELIRSANQVQKGQGLRTRLSDGEIRSTVEEGSDLTN